MPVGPHEIAMGPPFGELYTAHEHQVRIECDLEPKGSMGRRGALCHRSFRGAPEALKLPLRVAPRVTVIVVLQADPGEYDYFLGRGDYD